MPYPVAAARGAVSGGGGFVGPYDAIPSIAAAYGMRRLRSAYTGNLLRLRRASDNAEQDFGYLANGDLDAAAIATFLAATTGYVTTWYDQSGNGNNATQSTANAQPQYTASVQNGKPGLLFDGSNDWMDTADVPFDFTRVTLMVVAKSTATGWSGFGRFVDKARSTSYGFFLSGGATPKIRFEVDISGTDRTLDGTTSVNAADTAHLITSSYDGLTMRAFRNGALENQASYTGDLTTNNETLKIGRDGASGGADYLKMYLCNLLICSEALSDADRGAAETATNAYWGVY